MSITRNELRKVINDSCAIVRASAYDTARLLATADGIDTILVGDFKNVIDGQECGCPATLAGYMRTNKFDNTLSYAHDTPQEVRDFPFHFDAKFTDNVRPRDGKIAVDGYSGPSAFIKVVD